MESISFTVKGNGHPLILLHGFPMNQSVWDPFALPIASYFKVYTPDLPGFGGSDLLPMPYSINSVATRLLQWMDEQTISNSVVIGHSLGGYVALAMVRQRPEKFAGLGLFHSTAYPDTEEKKQSRTKTIEFVRRNGAPAFTSNFIQPLFANPEHGSIAKVRALSSTATEDAVVGYLEAMKNRPGQEEVLSSFTRPILFLAGLKDQGIPSDTLLQQAKLCKFPTVKILDASAHMGMFEEPDTARFVVQTFVEACY